MRIFSTYSSRSKAATLPIFYLAVFIGVLPSFLSIYVMSSYLHIYVSESVVGMLYILSAALAFLGLQIVPISLSRYGAMRTILGLSAAAGAALLTLAYLKVPAIVIAAFFYTQVFLALNAFVLDMLAENLVENESNTGGIRGTILTAINIAVLICPLIGGFLIQGDDYSPLFILSGILLIPYVALLSRTFNGYKDPVYERLSLIDAIRTMRRDYSLRKVYLAQVVMRMFYAWMVIYTPLYLHSTLGIPWSTLGIMFTIMLLPFVLLELPIGRIADRYTGEKELMAVGFVIMALATALFAFHESANPILWTLTLVMTRIGASMVEITTESFFFKHVDGADSSIISLFRTSRPLAYIITPAIATVTLIFLPLSTSFLVLSGLLIFGVYLSYSLVDTR